MPTLPRSAAAFFFSTTANFAHPYNTAATIKYAPATAGLRPIPIASPCTNPKNVAVCQSCVPALGTLEWRGRRIDPRAIGHTALLTVEGERDDICAPGLALAAHELCPSLRPHMKRRHMQAGVGHYGVFPGKRWANRIYPILRHVILSNDRG